MMGKPSMGLRRQGYETSTSELANPLPMTGATSTSLAISLPPIEPSLIVVRVPLVVKMLLVRTAMELLAPNRYFKFGVPLPLASEIVAIYPRKGRAVDQAQAFARMVRSPDVDTPTFVRVGSSRDVDFGNAEGQELVRQVCERHPGAVVTLCLSIRSQGNLGASVEALSSIATDLRVYLIVFVQTDDTSIRATLQAHADDYVDLNYCESDPEVHATFSIAALELQELNGFGGVKQMCEIRMRNAATLQCRLTNFVSAKKLNRLLFDLEHAGWPRDRLATYFSRNKSTISRALAAMPQHAVRPKLTPGGFRKRAESLGLDPSYWNPRTNAFGAGIQQPDEDDDDRPDFDEGLEEDTEPDADHADDGDS